MTVLCPHYTLSGRLWYVPIVPSADYIGYNHQLDAFDRQRARFAPHAQEACRRFAETLRDLCAAGF